MSASRAHIRAWCAGVALALVAQAASSTPATALRSPWDGPAPRNGSAAAASCPAPPSLAAGLEASDYYSDSAHSVTDPVRYQAYRAAVQPLNDAEKAVAAMADAYRRDGDPAMARCVAEWLASFARSGALTGRMSSNQASYVQGWTLGGFAIEWLKVRSAPGVPADASAVVPAWLGRVAALNRDYFDGRPDKTDGRNNHRYWAGLAVMAAGIAAQRRDEFDWGLDAFHIGARQVDGDGVLPLEMARRAKALHYHLFAAAPLVVMAELAAANDVDLYREDDGALRRLGRRALSGVADPSFFAARAGIAQEPVKRTADSLAWAIPFERRYPDPAVYAMLAALPSTSVLYLGGSPPP